jgi:hypothetical protein
MQASNQDSAFAAVVGLGALKSEHRYKGSKWVGLVAAVLCLAAVPVGVLITAYLGYDAYQRYGLRRVDDAVILPLIVVGIIGVIGVVAAFNTWRNWPLAARLYENGFALNERSGLRQVRWDQVEAVWQSVTKRYYNGVYVGTTHVYTVRTNDAQKVVLDDRLVKVEDMGKAIQYGTSQALWPRYIQALQAGQRVTFGPFALDAQGMYSGKKALQWKEIKAVKIQRGMISVRKEGGWLNWAGASVPQIPNFYIFYDLLARFTKVE